ncbi:MAG: DUF4403 family protein [Bacteroidota bacterium]|jgi:hypothetical protein|nr:DUF4403 family protein [Bacteroidota bacterium]
MSSLNFSKTLGAICAGSLWLFSACGSIQPEAPTTANQIVPVKPMPSVASTINIPIRIELKPFIKLADQSFDKEFKGADNPCSGLRYQYKLKREPIQLSGKGKTVFLGLDVAYGFSGEYCAGCVFDNCINPPIPFSCGWGEETLRRAKIKLKSDVELTSNYRIKSSTSFTEFTPIDPCRVTFAQININDVLMGQIRPELGNLAKMIDTEIGKQDLKPYILPVWKALQEDIQIPSTGYLRFQPQSLSVSEINMNGSVLNFNVGLTAIPTIQSTPWNKPSSGLPTLSPYKKGSGFEVYTDLKMNYDSLSKQLFDIMKTESYALGKEKINITSLRLFPAGEKLGVAVGFAGTKKGMFYLLGNPAFDNSKASLALKNVEYDIATKNVLIKTAKWMMDETIRKKLEEQMVFDLSDLMNLTKKSIAESLNQTMDGGVKIKGTLKSLEINGWSLQQDALWVRAKTLGDIQVIME